MLYRVIDEHLVAFLETTRRPADGVPLPAFVEREFRDFLTGGILVHEFARLRCTECALERAWAALMRRAFDVDVLACPCCCGRLRLFATVEDPEAIGAILAAASREESGLAPPSGAGQTPNGAAALGA